MGLSDSLYRLIARIMVYHSLDAKILFCLLVYQLIDELPGYPQIASHVRHSFIATYVYMSYS